MPVTACHPLSPKRYIPFVFIRIRFYSKAGVHSACFCFMPFKSCACARGFEIADAACPLPFCPRSGGGRVASSDRDSHGRRKRLPLNDTPVIARSAARRSPLDAVCAFRRGGHDRPRVPSDRVPVDRVGNGYHPFRRKNRLPARLSLRAQRGDLR